MTVTSARRVALAAVLGSMAITAAAQTAKGTAPRLRIAIGGFAAAVVLTAAAGFLPGLVGALSVIVILTTAMTTGYDLVRPISQLIQ